MASSTVYFRGCCAKGTMVKNSTCTCSTMQAKYLKENVIAKSVVLFCLHPIASKHSAFSLTKVSVSEVPTILREFVWKEATFEATIWNCTYGSRAILCDIIGHYRNVRGLGKSMVVFRLFEKLWYSHERSTIFYSLYHELKYLVALQISPKIESLYGLGRQAKKL